MRRPRSASPCRSTADSDSFESAMNLCEPHITQHSDYTDNDSSLHRECMCIHNNCSCTCEISFIDSDNVLPVANSCTHNDINNSTGLSTSTDTDCSEIVNDTCVSVHNSSKFLFMPLSVKHVKISALLDSGSTINIMSYELFSSLPKHSCTPIVTCCTDNEIVVANGQKVDIVGTSFVKIRVPSGKHSIPVYILRSTSHPLILGTEYLTSHKIVLNFHDFSVQFKTCNLKCGSYVELPPSSESIIQVKVPRSVYVGTQGICMSSNKAMNLGLFVARAVVTVPYNHIICLKVFNATTSCIVLKKGQFLAKMSPLDGSCNLISLQSFVKSNCKR